MEKRARTGLKTFLYSSAPLKSFYLSYDSPSQCTTKAHAFRIQACWRLSNLVVFLNFNLAANLISSSCCHASPWKGVLNSTEVSFLSTRTFLFLFLNFLSFLYHPPNVHRLATPCRLLGLCAIAVLFWALSICPSSILHSQQIVLFSLSYCLVLAWWFFIYSSLSAVRHRFSSFQERLQNTGLIPLPGFLRLPFYLSSAT